MDELTDLCQASKQIKTNQHKALLKRRLLRFTQNYIKKTQCYSLIAKMVAQRIQLINWTKNNGQKENLLQAFSSKQAKQIVGKIPFTDLPSKCFILEQIALYLFDNILEYWVDFEIFSIIDRNKDTNRSKSVVYKQCSFIKSAIDTGNDSIQKDFCYELVTDISQDTRLFMTYHLDTAIPLSDAVLLDNLVTLVKGQKWYEILYDLELSTKGKHFILYKRQKMTNRLNLIATACIQGAFNYQQWLTFDTFFHNNGWEVNLTKDTIYQLTKAGLLAKSQNGSIELGNAVKCENALFNLLDKQHICEIIRMTISGATAKQCYNLYLTQKTMMHTLSAQGYCLAFIITDKPILLYFYKAINKKSSLPASIHTTSCLINNKNYIMKNLLNIPLLDKIFIKTSFREYKQSIILEKSQQNTHDYC